MTLARMSQGPRPLRRSGQGSPPLPPGPPSRAVKCIRGDVIALWGTAPRRTFGPNVYISRVCGVWDCRAQRFTQVGPGAAQAAGAGAADLSGAARTLRSHPQRGNCAPFGTRRPLNGSPKLSLNHGLRNASTEATV